MLCALLRSGRSKGCQMNRLLDSGSALRGCEVDLLGLRRRGPAHLLADLANPPHKHRFCTGQQAGLKGPPKRGVATAAEPAPVPSASPASPSFHNILQVGCIIEFRHKDRHVLGVIEGHLKKKWVVYDEKGVKYMVRNHDVTLLLPDRECSRREVANLVQQAEAADTNLVEAAWQNQPSISQPQSLEGMARVLLGDVSSQSLYTAYTLLRKGKAFFRQVGSNPPLYYRCDKEDVQTHTSTTTGGLTDTDAQRQQQQEAFVAAVRAALGSPTDTRPDWSAWAAGPFKERLEALMSFAISHRPSMKTRELAIECLRLLDLTSSPNAAVLLLEQLALLRPHEPIQLLRAGLDLEFAPELEQGAKVLAETPPPDPDAHIRRDLRHLRVVTIDSSTTREVDDGLSVEQLDNGERRVWVHVADPSRWLEPGDAFDTEARKRMVTLYTPALTLPMFPWALSEHLFSLKTGRECPALSFGVILDDTGGVKDYVAVPSTIVPHQSMTYKMVDEVLAAGGDHDLEVLAEIANKREKWRKDQGAIKLDFPECDISATVHDSGDAEVALTREEDQTPSHTMVEELMILAGEVAGRIGAENNLPVPFRSQLRPILPTDSELRGIPKGPCLSAAIRRRLPRGEVSSIAKRHACLGIDTYVQVTSPLRRYGDLLAHWQLKAHLRNGPPPFTAPNLDTHLKEAVAVTRARQKAETDATNYWVAEYFRQNQGTRKWKGTVLRWGKKAQSLASVLIEDIGLEVQVRLSPGKQIGYVVELTVAGVDVKSGLCRLEEKEE